MNYQIVSQDYGDAGTIQTLNTMVSMVNNSYLNPLIRNRAASITASCGREKWLQHACLDSFLRDHVRYINDPLDSEVLAEPVSFFENKLLNGETPYGDCAQISTYLATLLKSIGHAPQFKAIGNMTEFYHVFVVCEGQGIDPTEPFVPTNYEREMIVRI